MGLLTQEYEKKQINLFTPLPKDFLEKIQKIPYENITIWQKLYSHTFIKIGFCILSLIFLLSFIGPFITSFEYDEIDLESINLVPSKLHWFGTDDLGRDIFTRCWSGGRISLFVGISAAFIDVCIGVIYGGTSAFFSRRIDEIMMRISDVLYSLPQVMMVILFIAIIGSGLSSIILALTLTGWINMSRIVRGQILQLKEKEFVLAAISLGASKKRILLKHLIPNSFGSILTAVTYTIPFAIFMEAFLSFLGLGVQAPVASWGVMVSDSIDALQYYPWKLFFPSVLISITIFGFHIFGEGIRDVLDPKNNVVS